MKKCIVVIPVYKVSPTPVEKASFCQVLKALRQWDICLLTHSQLDLSVYESLAKKENKKYSTELFDAGYFSSVSGYNRLCLSKSLYERFPDYEYMLIYQLDAWVFRDELQYWCDMGYDYIGAPWFKYVSPADGNPYYTTTFNGVGNGGFSLRRIRYCLKVLSVNRFIPFMRFSYLYSLTYHYHKIKHKTSLLAIIICLPKVILKSVGIRNNMNVFLHRNVNEDVIFSVYAQNSTFIKHAAIPKCEEAARFSFELQPSFLYEKTGRLPFGCHAFEKYEYEDFWSKLIKLNHI